MSAPRRTLAAVVVSVAMLFAIALPAAAITGGQPDGNRHPNVGLIRQPQRPPRRRRNLLR
jgi:hypothetical protein